MHLCTCSLPAMSGIHGTLNAYLLTRSEWSHQQPCKVQVRPCVIPHHTVEETESWTVHATYSLEDPTHDPQPVHTLNEGWHSQSCMSWPLPTVAEFSPAVRHVILFSLVKHVTLHLYTDWSNTCWTNAFCAWLSLCSFCPLRLAGPPFIYLAILSQGIAQGAFHA